MAVSIIDGAGSSYAMRVTPEGAIPVSGVFGSAGGNSGSEVYIKAGSVQTYNPIGIGSVLVTNGSLLTYTGSTPFLGLPLNQIIRKASGSPAVNFIFSQTSNSVLLENLGSAPVYYAFDAAANPANSGTGFLDAFSFRSFDATVGSISVQSSGITSSQFQAVRLT